MSRDRRIRVLIALACAARIATHASAQTSESTGDAEVPARAIEEIVVTAQKKEQSIQDVPISVTALSGEFLREAGVDNLHELAEFAPNVRLTTNAAAPSAFVRGFGTSFGASTFDPTVSLALDELSIPKDIYLSDPIYDIERFEVLRGPQGTLFGKNTPAGLFNVTTGRPSAEPTGHLIARVGGLGVHRFEAAVGGPLGPFGDLAQFRFAAMEGRQAGDVRNTALDLDEPSTQQHAARFKLALAPSDDIEIDGIVERARTKSRVFHFQQHELRDSSVEFLRGFDPDFEDDGLNHQDSINLREGLERTTDRVQANLSYVLGDLGPLANARAVVVAGYTGFDQDAPADVDWSPAEVVSLADPNLFLYDQRSVEVRAEGTIAAPLGFGELELLAGYLYFEADSFTDVRGRAGADIDEYLLSAPAFELITGIPAPGGIGFTDLAAVTSRLGIDPLGDTALLEGDGFELVSDQDLTSHAAFGRIAWHLTERWTVDLGARLTFERKIARLDNRCFAPGLVCAALAIEEFGLDRSRRETDFSPKVTLQYRPGDDLTLFATRAQGFKSGGFNNFSFTSESIEVEPERAVSWESGAKGTILDDSLGYSATFFHMKVEDLQLQNLTGGVIQVRNAASARTYGLEIDFRWLTPWQLLSVHGAGAWTEGEFESFPGAPAPASSTAETQDLSGRSMPFVPRWQLNASPELRLPFRLPSLLRFRDDGDAAALLACDVLYRSAQFLDVDIDPRTRQGDVVTLDARLALTTWDDALTLAAVVRNVTDADAFEVLLDSLFYPGGYMGAQEFQRNFYFEVRYRW